jgi:hypothetical protein
MLEILTHVHFLPHVNKTFRVDGNPLPLKLAQLTVAAKKSFASQPRLPFLLIFHAPRAPILPEGLYAVGVDNETFVMHINPVHTLSPERQEYQAVFN